jgi:lysozyme family protein
MANWDTAYNWMMDNEDAARACAQVPDACPGGVAGPCYAISGINSGAWPAEFAAIAAADQASREPLVQQFYQNHFWNEWYAQLNSDEVCKRVFDFAVNGGSGTSVRCLQQAVNSLLAADEAQLAEDGGWGPKTLGAANAADPVALVSAFQAKRVAYYQAIVAANPAKAKYLAAWIARARK